MLTAVIIADNPEAMSAQVAMASLHAECLELRLDALSEIRLDQIAVLMAGTRLPVILTLRSAGQGGYFRGDEETRLTIMNRLATLGPAFMDIEHHVSEEVFAAIKTLHPGIKIIRSFHDFKTTPKDLDSILEEMRTPHADYYKIITTARSSLDSMRVLLFVSKHAKTTSLTAHAMGENGEFSRVLGAIAGNCFTYAALPKQSPGPAPGSLTLLALKKLYRTPLLAADSKIYALLGDPVNRSSGHIYHNRTFARDGIDAVYVRIAIKEHELGAFFDLARALPFRGFSITMPLKEAVLAHMDQVTDEAAFIRAANTVASNGRKRHAANTDGRGALDAIEAEIGSVKDKQTLIAGAGGTARAVALEAVLRGARVSIINRTKRKATVLAGLLGCRSLSISEDKNRGDKYDLIINTLPRHAESAIDWAEKLPRIAQAGACVMDVVYNPRRTLLLDLAEKAGLKIVVGRKMFLRQAALQQAYWRQKF